MNNIIVVPNKKEDIDIILNKDIKGIIIGVKDLSIYNFELTIEEIILLAQSVDKKIIIAMNKMIHNKDIPLVKEVLNKVATSNIEGILFYDIGIFKIAKDEELDLIDLNDLKAMLTYIGEKRKEYSLTYGNVTLQSIGSIQRNILSLQEEGGDFFFGLPAFNIKDLIHFDVNTGFGNINIFDAQTLFQKPTLYATIMLWILTTIYNEFPEIGDTEKPKLVLFFDEAHLIFNDMPEHLTKQIIQIVKLIRSKGVGIYFISQSPSDIPTEILSQLGNRIQHVLRSYTPTDEKAIKAASDSFRKNPNFNTAEVISTLKTGEALISLQNEDGEPTIVDKYIIVPPQSMIGTITDIERDNYIKSTWLYGKYEEKLNLTSTKDILNEKLKKEKEEPLKKTRAKAKKSTMEKATERVITNTASSFGRKLGNSLFKNLFK